MPIVDVTLGKNVEIPHPDLVNLYGCTIGDNCFVGPFVEIQRYVVVGESTRIQSHALICSKARIGKNVFVSHGVVCVNDRHPVRREPEAWEPVVVGDNAVLGSNATIMPCTIGDGAVVGAGSVVLADIPENTVVAGNPAKAIGKRS